MFFFFFIKEENNQNKPKIHLKAQKNNSKIPSKSQKITKYQKVWKILFFQKPIFKYLTKISNISNQPSLHLYCNTNCKWQPRNSDLTKFFFFLVLENTWFFNQHPMNNKIKMIYIYCKMYTTIVFTLFEVICIISQLSLFYTVSYTLTNSKQSSPIIPGNCLSAVHLPLFFTRLSGRNKT